MAIDSCVARRPPALKSCAEDAAVERMAQLILMASDVAQSVLQQLLGSGAGPSVCSRDGVAAFQRGFRETLTRVLRIKVGDRREPNGIGGAGNEGGMGSVVCFGDYMH